MPVVRVDTLCECEVCHRRFGVELESATNFAEHPHIKDFDDMAREEIISGNGTYYQWRVRGRATVDRVTLDYQPTIQADLMLCDVCSKKCDDAPIEGALTEEQVLRAIRGEAVQEDEDDEEAEDEEDDDETA